jgi:hypothetical protein
VNLAADDTAHLVELQLNELALFILELMEISTHIRKQAESNR